MRAKKVRGNPSNIGITGVVVDTNYKSIYTEATMLVRLDLGALGTICDYKAGDIAPTFPDEWEPILLSDDKACEEDFKRDLDRLLEREGVPV